MDGKNGRHTFLNQPVSVTSCRKVFMEKASQVGLGNGKPRVSASGRRWGVPPPSKVETLRRKERAGLSKRAEEDGSPCRGQWAGGARFTHSVLG